jgi:hypothetical protein
MIMTRTGELLEIALHSGEKLAVEVGRIRSAALNFERAEDGSVHSELVLMELGAHGPTRIEAKPAILIAVHERIAEIMRETAKTAGRGGLSVHAPARPVPLDAASTW